MIIKITIMRRRHHYFHTRSEDGVIVIDSQVIGAQQARQIIESNPKGRVIEGQLSFDIRPSWWTWCMGVQASAN